jgi:hypothetical protein
MSVTQDYITFNDLINVDNKMQLMWKAGVVTSFKARRRHHDISLAWLIKTIKTYPE